MEQVIPAFFGCAPCSSLSLFHRLSRLSLSAMASPVDFPYDVWHLIVCALIWDSTLSPVQSYANRAAVAAVDKEWKDRLYGTSIFWSRLNIFHALPVSRIGFFLSKCVVGPIDVTLFLRDVWWIAGDPAPATPRRLRDYVDSVFDALGDTSPRWRSFTIETEHPVIFDQVAKRCCTLSARSMESMELSYVAMRGYINPDAISHDGPAERFPWFNNQFPALRRVVSFCVPVVLSVFSGVRSVEITAYDNATPLPPGFLSALFDIASNLESVRLGAILPFEVNHSFALRSPTLRSLDLEFHRGDFAGVLFAALEVPSLVDLTVRSVHVFLDRLLIRPDVLSKISRFRVYSHIGDRTSIPLLFAALTDLTCLDLVHARPLAFEGYRRWALERDRLGLSCIAGRLRELRLPRCDLRSVVDVVDLLADNAPSADTEVGLRVLRVERPLNLRASDPRLAWLRNMVSNFALTSTYSVPILPFTAPTGTTSTLLTGTTAHVALAQVTLSSLYS
ncbi:hypothetical protein B0H16DRAFT_1891056 [Mycena metata]|uniref:Uncharacterized protein n=1 Tax=Mycena metata TaxID=1033252 RepID=A0AAD7IBW7_9AGAR|nr:hypothetical protein B0H16DRAFT_1891056 [Mycena metata]